jgi:hypothetical protein
MIPDGYPLGIKGKEPMHSISVNRMLACADVSKPCFEHFGKQNACMCRRFQTVFWAFRSTECLQLQTFPKCVLNKGMHAGVQVWWAFRFVKCHAGSPNTLGIWVEVFNENAKRTLLWISHLHAAALGSSPRGLMRLQSCWCPPKLTKLDWQ